MKISKMEESSPSGKFCLMMTFLMVLRSNVVLWSICGKSFSSEEHSDLQPP